jgi:hypothetical protein
MEDKNNNPIQQDKRKLRLEALPAEDGRNFVNAFTWLIKEAKKQNLVVYQLNKQNND